MNTTQTPEAAAHGAGEGAAAVSGQTSVKSAADTGRESTEAGHGEPRTLSGGRGANLPAAPSDHRAAIREMTSLVLRKVAAFLPVFAIAFMAGIILAPTPPLVPDEASMSEPPVHPVTALLAERPDCSVGDDHPDTFPVSAIVTEADGSLVESEDVDHALRIVFGEVESQVVVHAFCYEVAP